LNLEYEMTVVYKYAPLTPASIVHVP